MKAILLAGGYGTRLYPCTQTISKQMLPVAGKPMIFYPLTTLISLGIRQVCIITLPRDLNRFTELLDTGSKWGMEFTYCLQESPRGIADALIIAWRFRFLNPPESFVLMLGDQIFGAFSEEAKDNLSGFGKATIPGTLVLAVNVAEPQRYGVLSWKGQGDPVIREKPSGLERGCAHRAIPGIYRFSPAALDIARTLGVSDRGELEIVDVLKAYRRRQQLHVLTMPDDFAWFDAGTPADLHAASSWIMAQEERTGEVIGSPELAALREGFITQEQFNDLVNAMPSCAYQSKLRIFL